MLDHSQNSIKLFPSNAPLFESVGSFVAEGQIHWVYRTNKVAARLSLYGAIIFAAVEQPHLDPFPSP